MTEKNVPVAMIFFARPEQFKVVFECVRKAQPSKLFLIQDGPRNEKDIEKIEQCRRIAENIDWECEVYRNYSEVNLGCGKRIYSGLNWAFEHVDRLVILEDDCVPSDSFFPFCEELLERYKNDGRICMISGMNHLEECKEIHSDYFFSYSGSIAGWATWKRCWDAVDFDMEYLEDSDVQRSLKLIAKHGPVEFRKRAAKWKTKLASIRSGRKQSSWSYQFRLTTVLNSQMVIVPRVNMMGNIGAVENAANTPDNEMYVSKTVRKIYHLYRGEVQFPLKHPKFVSVDYEHSQKVTNMMAPSGMRRIARNFEVLWLRLRYGGLKETICAVKRRLKRLIEKGKQSCQRTNRG